MSQSLVTLSVRDLEFFIKLKTSSFFPNPRDNHPLKEANCLDAKNILYFILNKSLLILEVLMCGIFSQRATFYFMQFATVFVSKMCPPVIQQSLWTKLLNRTKVNWVNLIGINGLAYCCLKWILWLWNQTEGATQIH